MIIAELLGSTVGGVVVGLLGMWLGQRIGFQQGYAAGDWAGYSRLSWARCESPATCPGPGRVAEAQAWHVIARYPDGSPMTLENARCQICRDKM